MGRITFFLVIVFEVMTALTVESFICGGPEYQRTAALCSPFVLSGKQQELSGECCIAYREFVKSAKTTVERRQLCSCVQQSSRIRPASIAPYNALPGKCGLPFIFSADPSFDCNRVN
ncbi:hypothetical protein AgCh_030227 [Apium graveolens]